MIASTRIGWAAVVLILLAGSVWAGMVDSFLPFYLAAGTSDSREPAGNSAPDKRKQAEELLRRARQAMSENDFANAESCIAQAEALDVDYGPFHFGDTPKRARRELERKRRSLGPVKPSRSFSPLSEGKKDVPNKDPFASQPPESRIAAASDSPLPRPVGENLKPLSLAARLEAAAHPSAEERIPLENKGDHPLFAAQKMGPSPGYSPGGADPDLPAVLAKAMRSSPPPADPVGANTVNKLLGEARKALAVGDLRRSTNLVQQAEAENATVGPGGDSSEKVRDAIRKVKDLEGIDKNTEAYRRLYARNLLEQADALIKYGDFQKAEELAHVAAQQQVMFTPYEIKPQEVLGRIAALRNLDTRNSRPQPDANAPAAHSQEGGRPIFADHASTLPEKSGPSPGGAHHLAAGAVYQPENDATRNVPAASGDTSLPPLPLPPTNPSETVPLPEPTKSNVTAPSAKTLFEQGEAALKARDKDKAYQFYQKAALRINELDSQTAQRLQARLQLLSDRNKTLPPGGSPPNIIGEAAARQQALVRKIGAELAHLEANARAARDSDPQKALAILSEARKKVESSGLESTVRDQFLRHVDRAIAETQQFINENRPRLELAEKNNRIHGEVERAEKVKLEKQEKTAQMIQQINQLIDEQRYAEAQVLARQVAELDPQNPVAQQMQWIAQALYRIDNISRLRAEKENNFMVAMGNVDDASTPFDDTVPYQMPKVEKWREITGRRTRRIERMRHRSEREIEIERKLKSPVSLSFENKPLSQVIEYLAKITDVNIYLDPRGLAEEGVTSDTPVNINIRGDISLASALNLILQPLHLSYIIRDEVLKVTSEQMREGDVYTVTYNVADLVTPIPNFVPVPMGLDAAYQRAMANVGFGQLNITGNGISGSPMAVVANHEGKGNHSIINPKILAQISHPGGGMNAGAGQPIGLGPGGVGGGTGPDFDSLIDLIESTVRPTSWQAFGGTVPDPQPFETTLSLVIKQTDEAHQEIADLLEQLRRLQDLQVTIEVRFITLSDNFFERIGVDFDFDIHSFEWAKTTSGFGSVVVPADPATNTEPGRNTLSSERDKPATVGIGSPDVTGSNGLALYTSDLDIPFRQGSYGLAVPSFGGFDAAAGAQLGFAILSDIETYFFINAAQGDARTNLLQAPKVTLFNGQQAMVADQSFSPFVISVIPVVGDFAAAQQPVIVVLSEGTFMTVQAVISEDRRFVRLTVVPFFSKIGDVHTFTFTGSETTTTDTTRDGNQTVPDANTRRRDATSVARSGTTVQLPTFATVQVNTTVSVPDGGTVLLGGIKRLSEDRREFGVPMLDKIPYINRLFKNVGIGRETQSLMMMVTPRIIIQEEEEEALGVPPTASRRMRQYQ